MRCEGRADPRKASVLTALLEWPAASLSPFVYAHAALRFQCAGSGLLPVLVAETRWLPVCNGEEVGRGQRWGCGGGAPSDEQNAVTGQMLLIKRLAYF